MVIIHALIIAGKTINTLKIFELSDPAQLISITISEVVLLELLLDSLIELSLEESLPLSERAGISSEMKCPHSQVARFSPASLSVGSFTISQADRILYH